jgi:hypothetical protein
MAKKTAVSPERKAEVQAAAQAIQNGCDISAALDRSLIEALFPNGRDMEITLIPYVNKETGVLVCVSQPAYLAMRVLDLVENMAPVGLTKLLQFYSAPKTQRKTVAQDWMK